VEILGRTVAVTLGPKGRRVVLNKEPGSPQITKSGATVANEIELGDRFADMGLRLLRELGSKLDSQVGGGTTTTLVLAHAIISEGLKAAAAGMNPIGLKRGIDVAVDVAAKALTTGSNAVNSKEEMVQIATIASNGDGQVGRLLAEAMQAVGCDGLITVEETNAGSTTLELTPGTHLNRGYVSPAFITNTAKMAAELDDVVILLHDKRISDPHILVPILEKVARSNHSLLIIAEDVEGVALATLVLNKVRGKLKVAAVKAPGTGARRLDALEDLAILAGGHVISEECGLKLENVRMEMLGRARRVIVEKNDTTIIDGGGLTEAVDRRIRQLGGQLAARPTEYESDKLRQRLARLSGRSAVIKVGGMTEIETKERKQRVDNALQAMKAAAEEGVVPGGGLSLLCAADALTALIPRTPDEAVGIEIVRRALSAPLRQIAENTGIDGGSIVGKLLDNGSPEIGFDAQTGEFKNMADAGLLDPTKTILLALRGAGSLAALILTTGVVIADKPRQSMDPHHCHSHCGCDHNDRLIESVPRLRP